MHLKFRPFFSHLNRRDTRIFPKINNTYFKIIFIFLALISTVFIAKSIIALESTGTKVSGTAIQEIKDKNNAFDNTDNLENWTEESTSGYLMLGIRTGLGEDIPDEVWSGDKKEGSAWLPGGLIGVTNKSIASLYKIPISGVEYVAHLKNNLLGKPAYAKSGFEGLFPILEIWKGFRNATYVLFSLIFIVMGIMIMLRVKISPQVVINIQNSIPKLITSLILVTFSYAIVGFLIDFSYVITGIGISIIRNATSSIPDLYSGSVNPTNSSSIVGTITNPQILSKLFEIANVGGSPWILAEGIIGDIIFNATSTLDSIGSAIAGGLAYPIVFLVLIIIIFVNIIKFAFGVAKCYVSIILKTIIAPLEIALGAIPNMKMGFGTWFIDIFANLMVFPISLIVLTLVKKIMDVMWANTSYIWAPPMISSVSDNGHFIATLFGLGGVLLLAKLPKLIPEFIFQIKPSPFGQAIGESFAPIGAMGGKAAKGAGRSALQGVGGKMEGVGNGSPWRNITSRVGKAIGNWSKK